MPLASCDANSSFSGFKWPKMLYCTSLQLSLPKECNGAIDDANGVTWPKSHDLPIVWPKEFNGPMDNAIGIVWCQCQFQWGHELKGHVAPHFSQLKLRNAMVPFFILLALCDANASANSITILKKLCCTSFQLSWLNKYSGAIDDAIDITWCWCQCKWQHMAKQVMLHLLLITLT